MPAVVLLTMSACAGEAEEPGGQPAGVPTSAVEAATTVPSTSSDTDGEPDEGQPVAPDTSEPEGAAPGGTGPEGSSADALEFPGYEVVSLLQDWSEFASDDALEGAIGRNLGAGGDNSMSLRLVPDGLGRLAVEYEIDELDPHDFVGFNRDLGAEQDWTGATHVAVRVEPVPGAEEDFVFQWRENSREVWRYAGPLGEVPDSGLLLIPLDQESFERAAWSGLDNGQIDLGSVNQYGLYVGHAGPGVSGTMTVGPIVAVRESD